MTATPAAVRAALASAHRDEWAVVFGSVVRLTGDWSLAEDCAQDAFVRALDAWERDGVPRNPGAWLVTTARHRAIDVLRRSGTERAKLAEAYDEGTVPDEDDERLRLVFTCCHPALPMEGRVALTLRAVMGLTTAEIATVAGGAPLALETEGTQVLDDVDEVDNPQCLGAWAPAQQTVYAGSGQTGAAVQQLRALNEKAWQDSVIQAALSFPSLDKVGVSYVNQRGEWALCGGKPLTVTAPGEPAQTWDFGQPVTTAGVLTLSATLRGGNATCQHGILERGNVLIDIRQCRGTGADVAALVTAAAAKVPHR